jgi:hypothetical protein
MSNARDTTYFTTIYLQTDMTLIGFIVIIYLFYFICQTCYNFLNLNFIIFIMHSIYMGLKILGTFLIWGPQA